MQNTSIMTLDIRWHQRFENFSCAFCLLREALEKKQQSGLSSLEQEGLIQRFQYSYEMAWKTLKDYLEYTGIVLEQSTPRFVVKKAFEAKIILGGDTWIKMIEARNLISHIYDKQKFDQIIHAIEYDFFPLLEKLFDSLLIWKINTL